MYDRILVPTDGSEAMEVVVDHARQLAEKHDAQIHALYVADTASLSDLPMESSWEGVSSALREQGKQAIAAVEEMIGDRAAESAIVNGLLF
jgi:nucleotide-binding universal stress UspA family protein